jgi:hypothetical protein
MVFSHDDAQLACLPDHAPNPAKATLLELTQSKVNAVGSDREAFGENNGISMAWHPP